MCYNQTGDISTLEGTSLKLVEKFNYLGSSVSSTKKDIDTRLKKAWTAIDRLSIIWKSDLTDKMKRSFLQAAVVSILLYGCTTWTLTKRLEKKLDGNSTRMLLAIFNKSWRQHPHKTPTNRPPAPPPPSRELSKLDEPDMQDTAREAGTSLLVMYSYGSPHMAEQKQDDQLEHTYISYVMIRDVALRTWQRRWTMGKNGERASGISVLAARHDDDDDDDDDINQGLLWSQVKSRHYPAETITNTDYTEDSASCLRFLPSCLHQPKPNSDCIAWSRQQKALASTWMQPKQSTCDLKSIWNS